MRSLCLLFGLATTILHAQEPLRIWGLTPSGGANNKGTVFSVGADGSDFTTVYTFTDSSGWGPEGGLCLAPNGIFYGCATFGGVGTPPAGTLFSIDPATGAFTKLHDFSISDGGYNWGTPIVGSDGLLYFAGYAGSDGGGGIFRLDPATDTYTEVYALDQATDGASITGRLLMIEGLIYGAASQGGANNQSGTLFRYDPATDQFIKMHDFDGEAGGRTPYGGLCSAGNGWLYGTTFEGGLNNRGTLYKYHPWNDTFVTLYDFAADEGLNSWTSLVAVGPDLLLGGVATGNMNSAGYLFTVVPSTDAVELVTNFSLAVGANPVGDITLAPDGTPYLLLSQGGTAYFGTLCSLDPVTFQPTVLHDFTLGADGGLPRGEVAFTGGAVSVQEQGPSFLLSATPNPTDGRVTLRCSADQLPAQVRIADALGRVLDQFRLTATVSELDLGTAAGVRIITVIGRDQLRMERVVVR